MDHPIRSTEHKDLRRRMVRFLSNSLVVHRSSNIVFVCGGNKSHHMRTQFKQYCKEKGVKLDLFLPEEALESSALSGLTGPFDLADYECLAGSMSHAILVFPEAPGSYAETGYFSAIEEMVEKCLLVLDQKYQDIDSFISLGPAKKIREMSKFDSNISIDYCNPNFGIIVNKIENRRKRGIWKNLSLEKFGDLNEYELAALAQSIIDMCRIATTSDIEFFLTAIFDGHISRPNTKKVLSVLSGCGYINEVGQYGHYCSNEQMGSLSTTRDGSKNMEIELRLSITSVCHEGEPEFVSIFKGNFNAY